MGDTMSVLGQGAHGKSHLSLSFAGNQNCYKNNNNNTSPLKTTNTHGPLYCCWTQSGPHQGQWKRKRQTSVSLPATSSGYPGPLPLTTSLLRPWALRLISLSLCPLPHTSESATNTPTHVLKSEAWLPLPDCLTASANLQRPEARTHFP